jgi:serine/threonine protein kinase
VNLHETTIRTAARRIQPAEQVSPPDQVVDDDGKVYNLTEELGEGGQGKVFATENGKLAVKLVGGCLQADIRLAERIRNVRRLPLDGIPISRPLAVLREPTGYVMEWLTGMTALGELQPKRDDPEPLQSYAKSGGLRRRLRLLAKVADALAALHGQGLVFADPSPNNIFVSEDPEHEVVRLIDPDNLAFEGTVGGAIYTPFYGAPELVRGEAAVDTLTDAHAFATLAFETLTLVHPLIGEAADASPEAEEQALAGGLPWVDHPEDVSNRTPHGLPRDLILSTKLGELFERTFGTGLTSPLERPGMATWAKRLHGASNMTLVCASCEWSYYVGESACPLCQEPRPVFGVLDFQRWVPGSREQERCFRTSDSQSMVLQPGRPVELTRRLTHLTSGQTAYDGILEVELAPSADYLELRPIAESEFLLATAGWSQEKAVDGPTECKLAGSSQHDWNIHFGPRDKTHRVGVLKLFRGQ